LEQGFGSLDGFAELIEGRSGRETAAGSSRTEPPPFEQPLQVRPRSDRIRTLQSVKSDTAIRFLDAPQDTDIALAIIVPYSRPCRETIAAFQQALPDLPVGLQAAYVTVDEKAAILERFGVRQFPTVVVIRRGQVVDRFVGNLSAATLKSRLVATLA
jgi:hypothetical protein